RMYGCHSEHPTRDIGQATSPEPPPPRTGTCELQTTKPRDTPERAPNPADAYRRRRSRRESADPGPLPRSRWHRNRLGSPPGAGSPARPSAIIGASMELNALQYFREVARLGNITAAARKLRLTQPT